MLSFPAANRDPAMFPDADKVIIDRKENRHAAFGLGIHRCIGSNLARMELTVAVEELLEAHPGVPSRRRGDVVGGHRARSAQAADQVRLAPFFPGCCRRRRGWTLGPIWARYVASPTQDRPCPSKPPSFPSRLSCRTAPCCGTTASMIGAVVDPGGDVRRIQAGIAKAEMSVEKIILTHGHIDHAGGAAELKEALGGVPIEGPHRADDFLLEGLEEQALQFGMDGVRNVTPDRWLDEGDTVTVAGPCILGVALPGPFARLGRARECSAALHPDGRRAVQGLDRPHRFRLWRP